MKDKSAVNQEWDEVERLRQVRRELESRFATTDEFVDWLVEAELPRRGTVAPARSKLPRKKTSRTAVGKASARRHA